MCSGHKKFLRKSVFKTYGGIKWNWLIQKLLRNWSPRTLRVATLSKIGCQIFGTKIFYRFSVGNQSFHQPVELLWDPKSTLDILKRYGCLWIDLPHRFVIQTRKQKSWWGWLGCIFADSLPHQKLFSWTRHLCTPRNFCHFTDLQEECSRNSDPVWTNPNQNFRFPIFGR